MDSFITTKKKNTKKNFKRFLFLGPLFILLFILGTTHYEFFVKKPEMSHEQIIFIKKGYSLSKSLEMLREKKVIAPVYFAPYTLKFLDLSVKSGPYRFKKGLSFKEALERLHGGIYGDVYKTITIPEGSNNKQIREIIMNAQLKNVHQGELERIMYGREGIFFPDTYKFILTVDAQDITDAMIAQHKKKIKEAFSKKSVNKTEKELVIMASLIVKEATDDPIQKQMIADILWRRIARGQRLQIDAPFLYEYGPEVKVSQVRKKASSFNTYLRAGLTPAAIANPDYDSLYAAAHPKANPYYFYLHGKNGDIHYAKDYQGHLKNIRTYLK